MMGVPSPSRSTLSARSADSFFIPAYFILIDWYFFIYCCILFSHVTKSLIGAHIDEPSGIGFRRKPLVVKGIGQ